MKPNQKYDVIIIGGGAAGLMAALCAGKQGKCVLLIEHTGKIGEKIRISGGGRCNFTNLFASSQNYISENPHFCKSALARYTQGDFIKMVEAYKIAYHEKTLGQLFCDGSSKQIINMLLDQCEKFGVTLKLNGTVRKVSKPEDFEVETSEGPIKATALIIACGGLSIPKIGASDLGYRIAKQFGHTLIPTRPALVPLIVEGAVRNRLTKLSGISNASVVRYGNMAFRENILFTHKGLSGPAILQISYYLKSFKGEEITIDLLPDLDLEELFLTQKNSKKTIVNYLRTHMTNRLVDHLAQDVVYTQRFTDLKKQTLRHIADQLHYFKIRIGGSEGYKKAEVTAGGVNTDEISSKTMESKLVPHLFFVGEVVDVTGWLGGYNFQWAWSSGYAAGNHQFQ